MNTRPLLLILSLALFPLACANDSGPPSKNGDGGSIETDAGSDATEPHRGDTGPLAGEWQIGTHTPYEATPESFVPITDGAEVPVVYGVQGSWMIVLAFRSRDTFAEPFDIVGEVTIDGAEAGSIWLELQETFPGGDGWDYYYNFFLALYDRPAQGTPARILVRVTDRDGTIAVREHEVLIGAAEGGP